MPTSIDSAYLLYYKWPAALTAVTSALTLDEGFYLALEARVLESMYAKYPTYVDPKTGVQIKDWQSVKFWHSIYKEELRDATAEKNKGKDDSPYDYIHEDYSGGYMKAKKTKAYGDTPLTIAIVT